MTSQEKDPFPVETDDPERSDPALNSDPLPDNLHSLLLFLSRDTQIHQMIFVKPFSSLRRRMEVAVALHFGFVEAKISRKGALDSTSIE